MDGEVVLGVRKWAALVGSRVRCVWEDGLCYFDGNVVMAEAA